MDGQYDDQMTNDEYEMVSSQEEIEEGDILLFPSSLFHRTIPFETDEDRICIAFDISPPL